MKTDVRILLVGDPGVGKTSLILSLVSEEFPEDVPAKAEEITIPADVTPERVPTHIVDYSSREQDDDTLMDEITKCHVVCVVYSVEDDHTLNRVSTHWMPLIRQVLSDDLYRPIILVGNKSDIIDATSMDTVIPIMNEFAEVETCVECSAKTLKNISEVFYYAQKAVLHPTAPLYLPEEKDLTSRCRAALTRVFKICDIDNDGVLSDREIYQFQKRCFNVPLQPQALEDVKQVIRKHIPEAIQRDAISQRGFLFLHTLFIQRGRHETTWTVLRKFGYGDNLQLLPDYVCPHLNVPPHCTTELSHHGYSFLTRLFSKYDEDNDGCLSPTELHSLFSTCPTMPWGSDVNNTVSTNAQGWVTLKGYLAQWTLSTLLDVSRSLEYLAYLGYMYEHDSQLSAIHVTRDKSIDIEKKQTNRNVFQCHVIGSKSSGKSSLLQGFLSRNMKYVATLTPDHLSEYAINTVQVYGQEKYLVLHEVDMSDSNFLDVIDMSCDVACFIYDVTNPSSFEYCASIYEEYFSAGRVPCLFVSSKVEQSPVTQEYPFTPGAFCHMYKLPPPQPFSCVDRINQDVYAKLAAMAAYPNLTSFVHLLMLHEPPGLWLQNKIRHMKGMVTPDTALWLKVIVGMTLATGAGFLAYKLMNR